MEQKHNYWLEINLSHITENTRVIKNFLGMDITLLAVIKSNAYGHGLVKSAQAAIAGGAEYLGIISVGEGEKLRKAGIEAPILLLGPVVDEEIDQAIKLGLTMMIYSVESGQKISKRALALKKRVKIHLKVDTGMSRFGIFPWEVIPAVNNLKRMPKLDLEGIYSHFSQAENRNRTATFKQLGTFQEALNALSAEKILPKYRHIANSAAALSMKSTHFNMVRIGITLYGMFPTPELKNFFDLKPALEFKTRIAQLKRFNGGEKVSYGGVFTVQGPSSIAVLPVGYAAGVPRGLSNLGKVLVKGQRCPIIGNICMEQVMVNVSDVAEVKEGDEVILIGKSGIENITPGEWAGYLGTINYEITTRIPECVPRVYIK